MCWSSGGHGGANDALVGEYAQAELSNVLGGVLECVTRCDTGFVSEMRKPPSWDGMAQQPCCP